MIVKNHLVVDNEMLKEIMQQMNRPIIDISKTKFGKDVPIFLSYDSEPKKRIGKAFRFRRNKDGTITCMLKLDKELPGDVAVVPSIRVDDKAEIISFFATKNPRFIKHLIGGKEWK